VADSTGANTKVTEEEEEKKKVRKKKRRKKRRNFSCQEEFLHIP